MNALRNAFGFNKPSSLNESLIEKTGEETPETTPNSSPRSGSPISTTSEHISAGYHQMEDAPSFTSSTSNNTTIKGNFKSVKKSGDTMTGATLKDLGVGRTEEGLKESLLGGKEKTMSEIKSGPKPPKEWPSQDSVGDYLPPNEAMDREKNQITQHVGNTKNSDIPNYPPPPVPNS